MGGGRGGKEGQRALDSRTGKDGEKNSWSKINKGKEGGGEANKPRRKGKFYRE